MRSGAAPVLASVIAGLLSTAVPLTAHHEILAKFDDKKPVTLNGVVTLTFKQGGLTNMFVESATDLAGPWTPVAGPFTNAPAPLGTNTTAMKFTNNATVTKIFYRLHGATP